MSVTKKIDNPKILDTCFFVFRYSKPFGAHATSNVCIYFQQKPFYGHPVGDTEVTPLQKRQIIQKYWTPISSVFRYLKPFGAHATSNVYIQVYIYIYIIIRANLRLPCRRYRGGSSTKKIDNPKILDMWFFVFRYFQPFRSHATSNFSIQRYIYIITVILRPNCRRQGGDSSTKIIQLRTLSYISTYIYTNSAIQ